MKLHTHSLSFPIDDDGVKLRATFIDPAPRVNRKLPHDPARVLKKRDGNVEAGVVTLMVSADRPSRPVRELSDRDRREIATTIHAVLTRGDLR